MLVLSLGAIAANAGSSNREKQFEELRQLGKGVKNQGSISHVPTVTLSPGRKSGLVAVEITAATSSPDVDYIWASDADTGEIVSGRRFTAAEPKALVIQMERGRHIVPSIHCTTDGTWDGVAFNVK